MYRHGKLVATGDGKVVDKVVCLPSIVQAKRYVRTNRLSVLRQSFSIPEGVSVLQTSCPRTGGVQ